MNLKLKENGLNYYLYPAMPTHPVTDWWANATLAATWCHRGNQVHHRRPVKDGAGVGGIPRVRVRAQSNKDDEVD
jgi:hypothetical protein